MEDEKAFLAATMVIISLMAVKYTFFEEHTGYYVLYIVGKDGTLESLRRDAKVGEPYFFKVFLRNELGYKEEFNIEVFVHEEPIISARRMIDDGDYEIIYFAIQFREAGPCWFHVVCTPASNPSLKKTLSVKINVEG